MDQSQLIEKVRKKLLNLHLITICVVTLAEFVGCLILLHNGAAEQGSIFDVFWVNMIIPVLANAVIHIVIRIANGMERFSPERKNTIVIYGTLFTTLAIAVCHRSYIASLCAFVFPMTLCTIFNDRKLLLKTFVASLICITTGAAIVALDRQMDQLYMVNFVILYAEAAVSYGAALLSITFSKDSFTIMEKQADANSRLRYAASVDGRTGLYNNRTMMDRLTELTDPVVTCQFCFAMVDVDNFKSVNDTYGHDCGDEVLVKLANCMQSQCRASDMACRYGGEEFAMILMDVDEKGAAMIMQRVLESFRSMDYDFTKDTITFSCGVAMCTEKTDPEQLIKMADLRLYQAKHAGKNQIVYKD